jgi:hypothetical protein
VVVVVEEEEVINLLPIQPRGVIIVDTALVGALAVMRGQWQWVARLLTVYMGLDLTCLLQWVGRMDLPWIWIVWAMATDGAEVEVAAEVEIGGEGDLTAEVRPTAEIEIEGIGGPVVTAGLAHAPTVAEGIAEDTTMIGGDTMMTGVGDLLVGTVVGAGVGVGAALVSVMMLAPHHAEWVAKLEIYLTCRQVEGAAVRMTTVSWTGLLPKRGKGKGVVEAGAEIVVVAVAKEARVADVAKNLQSDAVEADQDINWKYHYS